MWDTEKIKNSSSLSCCLEGTSAGPYLLRKYSGNETCGVGICGAKVPCSEQSSLVSRQVDLWLPEYISDLLFHAFALPPTFRLLCIFSSSMGSLTASELKLSSLWDNKKGLSW